MSPVDETILTIVQAHIGKRNALPVRDIMRQIGVTGDSYPVRSAIKRLVERHGFPIGAHPDHGVFMISTESELQMVTQNLEARSRSILGRVGKLREAYDLAVGAAK